MAKDLAKFAADTGVRFFLFNFTDLFGVQRAKLVPAEAAAFCSFTAAMTSDVVRPYAAIRSGLRQMRME